MQQQQAHVHVWRVHLHLHLMKYQSPPCISPSELKMLQMIVWPGPWVFFGIDSSKVNRLDEQANATLHP